MSIELPIIAEPKHVVVIIGGAVAGSEAAALCAERGILAVVIEQNDRPFGKIEDGLPRWHAKLREKEYAQIGENLQKPGVFFVPRTELGSDLSIETLRDEWGASAILLASGAWRDRPLFSGAEEWVGRGLAYQNPLVYWYNHYPDEGFAGTRFEIPDGTIVVGGGLASIDVVKIINFELYKAALARHGVAVTTLDLEHDGIPQTLAKHGLTQAQLGVQGTTLYYRREKTAMPLASAPPGATPEQLRKIGQVRAKVMDKVIEKYLVRFEPNHAPLEPLAEEGRMVGLRFLRTATDNGKLVTLADSADVRAPLVISSIGSVPRAIAGLPMKGELIDFEDWDSGRVRGFDNVFGLGNVLTGKGNIKESRKNAALITAQVAEAYLGVGGSPTALAADHEGARERAERAIAASTRCPKLAPAKAQALLARVAQRWNEIGYESYDSWLAKTPRAGNEAAGAD